MTNSDRYSPDDYNPDQIDEDAVEQQGTVKAKSATKTKSGTSAKSGKAKPEAGKRKATTSGSKPGTVATRAKRTDNDQDGKKAGAKATVDTVSANSTKNAGAKKLAKKAVKKTATNRVGKAALSKEATMKAMAKQVLVANSTAKREALKGMSLKGTSPKGASPKDISSKGMSLKKTAEGAGTGIVWTLLGIGLAACGGGTSYVDRPVTKEVPVDPTKVAGDPTKVAGDPTLAGDTPDPATAARLNNTPEEIVTVAGGAIANATVYGRTSTGDLERLGKTDLNGHYKLTEEQKGKYTQFEADLTGATDVHTGQTSTGGKLTSLAGSRIVSSLSTVIQEAIDEAKKAAAADGDDATTDETATTTATNQMLAKLFGANSGITLAHLSQLDNFKLPGSKTDQDADDRMAEKIEGLSIRLLASLEKLAQQKAGAGNPITQEHYQAAVNDLTEDVTKRSADDPITEETDSSGEILASDAPEVTVLMSHARQVSQGRPTSTPAQNLRMFEDGLRPDQLDQVGTGETTTTAAGETLSQTTEKAPDADNGNVNLPGDPKSPPDAGTDGTREAAPLTITSAHFGYTDRDADDVFGAITFVSISSGVLTYVNTEGKTVRINNNETVILANMKEGTHFSFVPDANFNGNVDIKYHVHDMTRGGTYDGYGSGQSGAPTNLADDTEHTSAEQTLRIIIESVNDRPTNVRMLDGLTSSSAAKSVIAGVVVLETSRGILVDSLNAVGNSSNRIDYGEITVTDTEDTSRAIHEGMDKPFTLEGSDSGYFKIILSSSYFLLRGKTDTELEALAALTAHLLSRLLRITNRGLLVCWISPTRLRLFCRPEVLMAVRIYSMYR